MIAPQMSSSTPRLLTLFARRPKSVSSIAHSHREITAPSSTVATSRCRAASNTGEILPFKIGSATFIAIGISTTCATSSHDGACCHSACLCAVCCDTVNDVFRGQAKGAYRSLACRKGVQSALPSCHALTRHRHRSSGGYAAPVVASLLSCGQPVSRWSSQGAIDGGAPSPGRMLTFASSLRCGRRPSRRRLLGCPGLVCRARCRFAALRQAQGPSRPGLGSGQRIRGEQARCTGSSIVGP